ncbi:MAG: DDE-type integrase/transposase/recombinase [Proteobacteria bacterium]|nr:DDE-type integrase/transposase/recombinase [Pseudomonadota bacterium]
MGLQALDRKPNTRRKHPQHPVFPYLLRSLAVERANQARALDVTYIPMTRGWVYLVAVRDWFSRRALSHRVSIPMEADFCVEALNEAVARYGTPEIVNTDQGSQCSSAAFVKAVADSGARPSMDGRGGWRHNVFVERLWRSIKYEEVYLKAYETVSAARTGIGQYLRPSTTRAGRTRPTPGARPMWLTSTRCRTRRSPPDRRVARRRGQPLQHRLQPAADPLISPRIVFKQARPPLNSVMSVTHFWLGTVAWKSRCRTLGTCASHRSWVRR